MSVPLPIILTMHFAAGVGLGVLYFHSLWWTTRRFTSGRDLITPLAAMVTRLGIMGGVFLLASLEGAMPMLVLALGFLAARTFTLRRIGQIA